MGWIYFIPYHFPALPPPPQGGPSGWDSLAHSHLCQPNLPQVLPTSDIVTLPLSTAEPTMIYRWVPLQPLNAFPLGVTDWCLWFFCSNCLAACGVWFVHGTAPRCDAIEVLGVHLFREIFSVALDLSCSNAVFLHRSRRCRECADHAHRTPWTAVEVAVAQRGTRKLPHSDRLVSTLHRMTYS